MELYQNIIQTNYKLAKITKMKGKRVRTVGKIQLQLGNKGLI